MNTIHAIYGPPGTGKTFKLLSIVEEALQDYEPERIGFIAFTRKAANEAKTRAQEKFELPSERLPWFRTLHSTAFSRLGLNRNQVMGLNDYLKLCDSLGLSITFKNTGEDGTFAGMTKGDRLFFTENMSRATMTPLKDHWEKMPDEDIYWYELERLSNTLKEYKEFNGKMDFTDMVYKFIEQGEVPELDVLLIDEAQDLTPLQWKMCDKLIASVDSVFIAGDDDQAIFRWAGADVEHFIDINARKEVLEKSYRVPREIQVVADKIISNVGHRVPKIWNPRAEGGSVQHVMRLEELDMSKGTWLLLGRNVYLLDQFVDHCLREGFVFDSPKGSPVKGESFRAILFWEKIRRNEYVRMREVKNIYDHMTTKVGVAYGFKKIVDEASDETMVNMEKLKKEFGLTTDKIWHEALDKLKPHEVEYFIAALKRGEKLSAEPRIKISTIHGAKGGEAENVVILTDMADRTFREMQLQPDDEHRVWYVAVTRAKENLFIMQPQTNKCYVL